MAGLRSLFYTLTGLLGRQSGSGFDFPRAMNDRDSEKEIVDRLHSDIEQALERISNTTKTPGTTETKALLLTAYSSQLMMFASSVSLLDEFVREEELALIRAEDLEEGTKKDRQRLRKQVEKHKAERREKLESYRESVKEIIEQIN